MLKFVVMKTITRPHILRYYFSENCLLYFYNNFTPNFEVLQAVTRHVRYFQ